MLTCPRGGFGADPTLGKARTFWQSGGGVHHKLPPPLAPPSESLDKLAALEFDQRIFVSAEPVFRVAIDCGCIARLTQGLDRGRLDAVSFILFLHEAAIFVLTIDGADRAVLFTEGDREEFAVSFFD